MLGLRAAAAPAASLRAGPGAGAHAGPADRTRALAAGMDVFLVKPVALDALWAAVTAAGEGIEIVFSETVPLVAPASAAPSIKTHIPDQTFASPH